MISLNINAVATFLIVVLAVHVNCEDCPAASTTYNVYQAFGADANPGEKAAIFARAGEVCECGAAKVKELEDRLSEVESLVNMLLGGQNNSMLKDDGSQSTGFPSNFGEEAVGRVGGYNDAYESCPGIIFQDSTSQDIKFTCFYVVDTAPTNYEGAMAACGESSDVHDPTLAAIKTKNSFDAVVAYLRDSLLQTQSIAHVWLGGDYDPTNGGDVMTWHDGVKTEETGTWYPHYPYTVKSHGEKYGSWRKLSLIVRGQVDFAGISNRADNHAFHPLCQYEIRV